MKGVEACLTGGPDGMCWGFVGTEERRVPSDWSSGISDVLASCGSGAGGGES